VYYKKRARARKRVPKYHKPLKGKIPRKPSLRGGGGDEDKRRFEGRTSQDNETNLKLGRSFCLFKPGKKKKKKKNKKKKKKKPSPRPRTNNKDRRDYLSLTHRKGSHFKNGKNNTEEKFSGGEKGRKRLGGKTTTSI